MKRKIIRQFMIFAIITTVVISSNSMNVHADEYAVNIKIDGHMVAFNDDMGYPYIDEFGRTQVPLRVTLETFGAVVGWDQDAEMVLAEYDGIVMHIPIGEKYIIVNGEKVDNDSMAVLNGERSYCPIRIVMESFGARVQWYGETRTVAITSPEIDMNTEDNQETDETDSEGDDSSETDKSSEDTSDQTEEKVDVVPTRSLTSQTMDILVVLTEFSNVSLSTTEEEWHEFFYNEENSVQKYYQDMSNGQVFLQGAEELYGMPLNGIISVELDRRHPNLGDVGYETFDFTEFYGEILEEATYYVDFSEYDKNGDNYVDPDELAVVVVVAGHEMSAYTHRLARGVRGVTSFGGEFNVADGVVLTDFSMSGELYAQDYGDESMATIGIITHEFGHLLGLPDLYDTDFSSVGLDFHGLMASGSNTYDVFEDYLIGEYPSALSAWSRVELGFIEPIVVSEDETQTLYSKVGDYNIIKIPTNNPYVYYLLENRQFEGYLRTFNFYMDFPGVAIWRVDEEIISREYVTNSVNDTEGARGVELIEATGGNDLYQSDLDYWYTKYNHYFAPSWHNQYVTPEGIIIKIQGTDMTALEVAVDFPE